jgi:hypothetical protein
MMGAELVEVSSVEVEVEFDARVVVTIDVVFDTGFDVDTGVVVVVEFIDRPVTDTVGIEVVVEETELMDEVVDGAVVLAGAEDNIEEGRDSMEICEKPEGGVVLDELAVMAGEDEEPLGMSVEKPTIVAENVEFTGTVGATDEDELVFAVDEIDEINDIDEFDESNDVKEVDETNEVDRGYDEVEGRLMAVEDEELLAALVDVTEELLEEVNIIEELVVFDKTNVDELIDPVDVALVVVIELDVEVDPALDGLVDTTGTDEGAADDVGENTELVMDDTNDVEELIDDEL